MGRRVWGKSIVIPILKKKKINAILLCRKSNFFYNAKYISVLDNPPKIYSTIFNHSLGYSADLKGLSSKTGLGKPFEY